MKTGKKIAVALAAALAIAIFAGGAVSMVGAFELQMLAKVVDGTDVSVVMGEDNGNFGDIIRGTPATLTNALILTNDGTVPAKVEAKFLSSHGEVHGLVIVDTSVIAASNFEVGTAAAKVPLADNGDVVDLGEANYVPSDGGVVSYDATLTAGEAELGIHTGIIEVIISAA